MAEPRMWTITHTSEAFEIRGESCINQKVVEYEAYEQLKAEFETYKKISRRQIGELCAQTGDWD